MARMNRTGKNKAGRSNGGARRQHPATSAIALEPRFMFDAAGVATAADAATHDPAQDPLQHDSQPVDQKLLEALGQTVAPATQPAASTADKDAAPSGDSASAQDKTEA